jgi:hypothetical protein
VLRGATFGSVICFSPFQTLDYFTVMPLFSAPILPVNPAVPAEAVAVLAVFLTALAQFGRIQVAIMRCVKLSLVHFTTSFTQSGQRRRFSPRQKRNLLPATVLYVFLHRQQRQVVVCAIWFLYDLLVRVDVCTVPEPEP